MDTRTGTSTTTETIKTLSAHQWRKKLFDGRSLRVEIWQLQDWPLADYLWASIYQAKELYSNRDAEHRNWQTPAWDFGRFARAHPDLIDMDENTALRTVKAAIGQRFWETHLGMNIADAEIAFDDIWVKCRAIPGHDPVSVAVRGAKRLLPEVSESGPAGYETFLEVAKGLHHQMAGGVFLLPCHKLASMLDCKAMTISRYRQKAIREGRLKIAKAHTFRSNQKGEATEFLLCDSVKSIS
ncbi:MAG TPA: hypothetical protein VGN16_17475 [Acidobacteriaceae bacterium]|jgi:hypothetical protein